MGKCCKCGRETEHVYAYCSGDLLAKRPKAYTNVEERAGFFCTRCAMGGHAIWCVIASAACCVESAAYSASGVGVVIIIGIAAAAWFAAFVHALVVMRRDRALPFYVYKSQAEKRLVKLMRKQNPGITYFAPSGYHKRIGGITP
ncbi:MAG: hypothetical protein LBB75_04610 [Oscillospiraceae bacterium]|jgi:hypothetical protein|nr:hypothetical protein [Oscillospiraceae bacterium]